LIEASVPGENNSLPKEIRPDIIIDHHPYDAKKVSADYIDIRPELGANSTILTEYLTDLDFEISEELATLLFTVLKPTPMASREAPRLRTFKQSPSCIIRHLRSS